MMFLDKAGIKEFELKTHPLGFPSVQVKGSSYANLHE
jgi:hypothetical protein